MLRLLTWPMRKLVHAIMARVSDHQMYITEDQDASLSDVVVGFCAALLLERPLFTLFVLAFLFSRAIGFLGATYGSLYWPVVIGSLIVAVTLSFIWQPPGLRQWTRYWRQYRLWNGSPWREGIAYNCHLVNVSRHVPRLRKVQKEPLGLVLTFRMRPGYSVADFEAVVEPLAVAYKVHRVIAEQVEGRRNMVRLRLLDSDPLEESSNADWVMS